MKGTQSSGNTAAPTMESNRVNVYTPDRHKRLDGIYFVPRLIPYTRRNQQLVQWEIHRRYPANQLNLRP